MVERVDWIALGWMGNLLEAHNGYLETYLDSGIIGLALLVWMLLAALRRSSNALAQGSASAAFQFTLVVVLLLYNLTESVFNRFGPIWFVSLIALVIYPRQESEITETAAPVFEGDQEGIQDGLICEPVYPSTTFDGKIASSPSK